MMIGRLFWQTEAGSIFLGGSPKLLEPRQLNEFERFSWGLALARVSFLRVVGALQLEVCQNHTQKPLTAYVSSSAVANSESRFTGLKLVVDSVKVPAIQVANSESRFTGLKLMDLAIC
jgi:hypothetical protein